LSDNHQEAGMIYAGDAEENEFLIITYEVSRLTCFWCHLIHSYVSAYSQSWS
jgi:hypothetical protein